MELLKELLIRLLTNSYHVNVKEHIDAFDKLQVEAKFQKVSSGGAISYVEVTNMSENLDALSALITICITQFNMQRLIQNQIIVRNADLTAKSY